MAQEEGYLAAQKICLNDTVINYVPAEQMERERQIFYRDEQGEYYLRKFEDCKPSTITMVTYLEGRICNLYYVYHLLPTVEYNPDRRVPHPAGTITSVRAPPLHKDSAPLVAGEPGGVFRNSIFINVAVNDNKGKPISAKLSESKIQLSGPKDENMGRLCSNYIVEHIRSACDFVKRVQAEPKLFLEALEWICSHCTHEITTCQPVQCHSEFELYEDLPDYLIERELLPVPPAELDYFVEQILYRTQVLKYVSELRLRCQYILQIHKVASSKLAVDRITRSLVKFAHQLNVAVDRQFMADQLRQMGFKAEFVNTENSFVTISVDSEVSVLPGTVTRRKSSGNTQTFALYARGTLNHNGPGGAVMEDCYFRLMVAIISILDRMRK